MVDFKFLMSGGFMMVPLLISALIALTVIFERLYILRFKLRAGRHEIEDAIAAEEKERSSSQARVAQKSAKPVIGVIQKGLENFDAPPEELEIILQNQAEQWIPIIEKHLDILDTVITAAPLMGLLGTITGMMASFKVLSTNGVNEPNAITGGVAEALIATATGLVIALVSLVAFNYFNNLVKGLIAEMEFGGARVLEMRRRSLRNAK